MAPTHLHKRRFDYIESPSRNRRCMDTRKDTISDESIRTHCGEEPDTSASMLGSVIGVVTTWATSLVTSVSNSLSAPAPPPHNPKRIKRKPRRITTNGTGETPTRAAQIPLPPSPIDSPVPFQNLHSYNGTLPSPSPRKANGYHTSHQEDVKEKLRQELLLLRTSQGQSAAEVKEYLKYAEKIDRIDAAGGVFAAVSKHLPRRHSLTIPGQTLETEGDLNSEFLRKAIKRATDTLHTHRIPNNLPRYIDELKDLYKTSEAVPELPKALSPEDQSEVAIALTKRGTVAKFAREQVSDSDLARLKPAQWLNDEVINFYGALILARSEEAQKGKGKALDAHYFNTFFFAKLEEMGYEKSRIGKWTKKIDIFKKDVVLIPVNLGNAHWTCAAINFQKKRIEYHDSMGRKRGKIYKILREYLSKEHKDKKKKDFDFTGWEDYFDENAPQQENGYDCGVFSCQYMECISRGAPFGFTQANMSYLRQRMILEIMRGKLWYQ